MDCYNGHSGGFVTHIESEQKEFVDRIEQLGMQALQASFDVHERLGAQGEELVAKNQFGDTALRVDIEAEDVVIKTLMESGIAMIIYSEEHGIISLSEDPKLLVVLDGMDGSDEYKTFRGQGRYGTMLGIYNNPDPNYSDYLFGGIMEHAQNRLLWAARGKGAFAQQHGHVQQIQTSGKQRFGQKTVVYFAENIFRTFGDIIPAFISRLFAHQRSRLGSTAAHYSDLVSGRVDIVIEPSRKGNLEHSAAFPLVSEAGGDILTEDGQSIRDQHYLTFAQKHNVTIIAVATAQLGKSLIQKSGEETASVGVEHTI